MNKTVPLILCAEENVVGNHGATIGELDDETLFYFESRGIGHDEAENILARAAIERRPAPWATARPEGAILQELSEVLDMAYDYKQDFPLLRAMDVAYVDNAATAQRPQCVLDAENDFYCATTPTLCAVCIP